MKNINWLKIAGIVAVVLLVLISLFSFTAFLRKLPVVNKAFLLNFILTLIATVAGIYYISKTQYGSIQQKDNSDNNKI